jgi:hypothetical protein
MQWVRPVTLRTTWIAASVTIPLFALPAHTAGLAADSSDCRYSMGGAATATDGSYALESVLLPDQDVFRPMLADQREPRFYVDYRHLGPSPAARLRWLAGQPVRRRLRAVQSRYPLDGPPQCRLSGRADAHLPERTLVGALEDSWWRLYAGGGIVALSDKQPDLAGNGMALWGVELRSPEAFSWPGNSTLRPVVGASFASVQPTNWSINGSLEAGVEWAAPRASHRIRALLVAQRGAMPFSQFFSEKTENIGLQLQFEH